MIEREIHFHDRYGRYQTQGVPEGMEIRVGDKIHHLYTFKVVVEIQHSIEEAKTVYVAKDE